MFPLPDGPHLSSDDPTKMRYHQDFRAVVGVHGRVDMDQRSFQRLLRRTVLIPVVLLLLLTATLVVEIVGLRTSFGWVDHTDQVITNARQLMRYMTDMEAELRGFYLTRDQSFLDAYDSVKQGVPEQLVVL